MLHRSFKTLSALPFQSRYLLRPQSSLIRPFSSFITGTRPEKTEAQIKEEEEIKMIEFLTKNDTHVNDYMKKLSQYSVIAATLGVGSAYLFSVAVPVGFPTAFLLLGGFAMQHNGADYIERTKHQVYTYKDAEGKIQYSSKNDLKRKLAFVSTCLGYGAIIGSMMSIIPMTTSVLPLSAVGCLFSALGQYAYAKYKPKPYYNTTQMFISGLLTGMLGVNLVTSGSAILMLESVLHLENSEVSTYIGLLLYNAFTGHDNQKALEDVQNGKGDYLKHASKFSENWLYALVPHFLLNMYN